MNNQTRYFFQTAKRTPSPKSGSKSIAHSKAVRMKIVTDNHSPSPTTHTNGTDEMTTIFCSAESACGDNHSDSTQIELKNPIRTTTYGFTFDCSTNVNDFNVFDSPYTGPEGAMKRLTRLPRSEPPRLTEQDNEIIQRTKKKIIARGKPLDEAANFKKQLKFANLWTALLFPSDLDDFFRRKKSSNNPTD